MKRNLLEYYRRAEQNNTENYPAKCNSYGYKIKVSGNMLLLANFVTQARLQHDELGFNPTTGYYGYGSMIDTKRALVFLKASDAQSFAQTYGFRQPEIYISNNQDILVRIDSDSPIPVYCQEAAVSRVPENKMTPTQEANLQIAESSVDNVADAVIIEKNAKKATKRASQNAVISSIDYDLLRGICEELKQEVEIPIHMDTPNGAVDASIFFDYQDIKDRDLKAEAYCMARKNLVFNERVTREYDQNRKVEGPLLVVMFHNGLIDDRNMILSKINNSHSTGFNFINYYQDMSFQGNFDNILQAYKVVPNINDYSRGDNGIPYKVFDIIKIYTKANGDADLIKQEVLKKLNACKNYIIRQIEIDSELFSQAKQSASSLDGIYDEVEVSEDTIEEFYRDFEANNFV